MPEIGKILASWGQWILRSKQWRNDETVISGGVMTWTLYQPEDGSSADIVEGWIPFQLKFPLPDTQREGIIRNECHIRNVDARQISDRKIMVRANISMKAEILEPIETDIFVAENLPDEIQFLKRTYPVTVPKEAGEKTFSIDEDLVVEPVPEKILRYSLDPAIEEYRTIGDRMVFRGKGTLRILYKDDSGSIRSYQTELPFSQFADLDHSYPEDAQISLIPAVTELAAELDSEDRIRVKAGFTVQYLVFDRNMLEVVEDAYSPKHQMTLHFSQLSLPAVLDMRQESRNVTQLLSNVSGEVLDICNFVDHPEMTRNSQGIVVEYPVTCQVLFSNPDGDLQCELLRISDEFTFLADDDALLMPSISSVQTTLSKDVEGMKFMTAAIMDMNTVGELSVPVVTGLEIGEAVETDPGRPSVVLRAVGSETLWDIAKQWGSTVSAILAANHLQTEPEEGQLLLIPVP